MIYRAAYAAASAHSDFARYVYIRQRGEEGGEREEKKEHGDKESKWDK